MRNIIIFILIFSFTCFAGEYLKEGKSIYYMKDGQMVSCYFEDGTVDPAADCYSKPSKILLDNVDLDTFKSLNLGYAKDKNSVYYEGLRLDDSDPDTFKIIDRYLYSKDKNYVYFTNIKLDNSNSDTFVFLGSDYAKDKNNIYWHGAKLENADTKSFEILSADPWKYHARDKNSVYFAGNKILGSDAKTAEYLSGYFMKDKNNIYYLGKKMETEIKNTADLVKIDDTYYKDKNNIIQMKSGIVQMLVKSYTLLKYLDLLVKLI